VVPVGTVTHYEKSHVVAYLGGRTWNRSFMPETFHVPLLKVKSV
jgi:hypothetical protein